MTVIPVARALSMPHHRVRGRAVSSSTREFFVSTTGSASNPGTIGSPWTLAHALTGAGGDIEPGDTIWLRGGTYTKAGSWSLTVNGASGAYVDFRNYPGELALIRQSTTGDVPAIIWDNDGYVRFIGTLGGNEGIEIDNPWVESGRASQRGASNWFRKVPQTGNHLVQCIIHDGGSGVFAGNGASTSYDLGNLVIYGCIFYNNGHDSGPKTHGSYLRHENDQGLALEYIGNVVFNTLGQGVQFYDQDLTDGLNNITCTHNVVFNPGLCGSTGSVLRCFQFGGNGATSPLKNWTITNNVGFMPGNSTECLAYRLGAGPTPTNENVSFQDNYFVGGASDGNFIYTFRTNGQPSLSYDRNFHSSHGGSFRISELAQSGSCANFTSWTSNDWRSPAASPFRHGGANKTFATWKTDTGLGASDTQTTTDPTTNKVFVFSLNRVTQGYGRVAFFNWESSSNVNVDLSTILSNGDEYEVYNVQDIKGTAILSGTYSGGTVAFPTTGVTAPAAVGPSPRTAPVTAPFFDCFHVRRV